MPDSSGDARMYALALLSWTTDYERFAERLRAPRLRAVALGTGLAGPATVAVGETDDDGALLRHYERLKRLPLLARPSFEGTAALVAVASYLGAAEAIVAEDSAAPRRCRPRASPSRWPRPSSGRGRSDEATRTLDEALAKKIGYVADRRVLEHRRRAVLPPAPRDEDFESARRDVALRLATRRVRLPSVSTAARRLRSRGRWR